MPHRPTLVTNPADDRVFSEFAETVVEHGVPSAEELEERLRAVYPAATVHRRELAGEPWLVWYVYRDGHWVRSEREASTGARDTDAESTRRPTVDR